MEIRDPVQGSIYLSKNEVAILDTPEYQRLRAIKQLGFAEFSFPGATHNRYIHSIGVCHLAGKAFDNVFSSHKFSSKAAAERLRQCFRLAALLHDIGHGPLSHTTEMVMPSRKSLKIEAYKKRAPRSRLTFMDSEDPRADHEDYTIKFLTDSPLTQVLEQQFADMKPIHIACLIDKTLICDDDFFVDGGLDHRPLLSQLVSSELDVDRMDYLERDSYYCGTNYGKVDSGWLLANLTPYESGGALYLGLNRRALYTFDDFLISRHHMHLMVYFHHKSIVYEEMLSRYLQSPECTFQLPSEIKDYTGYNDYSLYQHLSQSDNEWAKRISERRPYRVLVELHTTEENPRAENVKNTLEKEGIECIHAGSKTRLSKYHTSSPEDRAVQIYVVDQYDKWDKPYPIEECTEIFQRYEGHRIIDRIYVAPENYAAAEKLLLKHRY